MPSPPLPDGALELLQLCECAALWRYQLNSWVILDSYGAQEVVDGPHSGSFALAIEAMIKRRPPGAKRFMEIKSR